MGSKYPNGVIIFGRKGKKNKETREGIQLISHFLSPSLLVFALSLSLSLFVSFTLSPYIKGS
jgi:hypothetical protein